MKWPELNITAIKAMLYGTEAGENNIMLLLCRLLYLHANLMGSA